MTLPNVALRMCWLLLTGGAMSLCPFDSRNNISLAKTSAKYASIAAMGHKMHFVISFGLKFSPSPFGHCTRRRLQRQKGAY